MPELVGGSADLAPSTLTLIDGGGSVEAGEYGGRNLHFGIREHAMGAIVNGLVLTGLRAYGAGFLIFSDYMKGAIRLAAIMRIPSTFVFTHDSIGVGEDGPTHQPIEQLVTLRATPNLDVVRPAGFNETALAWRHALRQTDRPTALALSRQGLPVWDPAAVPDDAIERGAYVLHETAGGDPELILMGTGSEVHIAHDAAKLLEADGIRVRLVSMPCLDRFAEQDRAYRDQVLPPAVRARVAVEAASPLGWHRWVGDLGDVVAMEGFGASAPAKVALRALRVHRRGGRRARPGRAGKRGGSGMSVTAVNERLAALTAAGTSVWLDQIRRGMIESGELARMVAGGLAARRHVEPGDLREGDPRLARLRRRRRRGRAREGLTRARGLPPARGARRPARRRRAARRVRRTAAASTATSRSRSRRGWRTTPTGRSSRRACTGGSSTGRT